ncbi:LysR substrate-binding domain-containing protein [Stutzerimonas chloritidismutans]|uniref:LysR substrate-binding domain-containing protein n=1 Tax=Stutzerimonas chloritidismutans TaxID=203192 RepID=UPI003F13797B
MDFRQLRYFVAVAEELSFSAAARRLHISQPPLSMQIKAMEDELGAPLLKRTNRRVELTQAGQLLLDEARRALAQLDHAGDVVRQAVRGDLGAIRIGFTASVPMYDAFPAMLSRYQTQHPGVRTLLTHLSTAEQLRALADKTLDVGFLRPSMLFAPPAGITVHELWKDRLVAVLPAHHPLARDSQSPVAVGALADAPFILFPRGLGCGLFEHVSALASRAGFAPRLQHEVREGTTILGLVAAGMGVSILPDIYARTGIPGVVYRPLDTQDAASRLLLAHRTGEQTTSPLLERLLGTVVAE